MVGHSVDSKTGLFQLRLGRAKRVEGIPDIDADVIQPNTMTRGRPRSVSQFDQQQFVMRASGGQRLGAPTEGSADFTKSEEISIEPE